MAEINKQIGRRIRALRTARQLTMSALAERSAMSEKHLGKIERGDVNPSVQCVTHIAQALDIPVASLLDAEHERDQQELVAAIVSLAPELSQKDAQIVFRLVKMLTNR